MNGHIEVVKFLIEKGADINYENNYENNYGKKFTDFYKHRDIWYLIFNIQQKRNNKTE